MSNVTDIRDARHAVDAAAMVNAALGALSAHRADVMALVQTIRAADAVQIELHTQMRLMGHDELTQTQDAAWSAADDARERARKALPGALGLTEADLQLLHGVI